MIQVSFNNKNSWVCGNPFYQQKYWPILQFQKSLGVWEAKNINEDHLIDMWLSLICCTYKFCCVNHASK